MSAIRVLVTGGAGTVAGALLHQRPAGAEVVATRRHTPVTSAPAVAVDLADAGATEAALRAVAPRIVVHTAYDARDGERDIVGAARNVAAACARQGIRLLHMSTDVVFDGEHAPYGEHDPPDPISAYGRWKLVAEEAVRALVPDATVVRTSLVVRAEPPDPSSAARIDELRRGEPMALFTDELRCPIAVEDLAAALWELVAMPRRPAAGVWHVAGPEALSRYALGLLLAARAGLPPAFPPAASADSPSARPRDVRLSTARSDAWLRTRPRPVSAVLAPTRWQPQEPGSPPER